jgi:integrase
LSVFKRPDSPFIWMLLERPGQNGIRESTKIPKEGGSPRQNIELMRQAKEIYAARMAELARRRFKLPTAVQDRSFRVHREWYAANVSVHKASVASELSILRHLGVFFDRFDLVQIDTALVLEWRVWRRQKLTAASVNRESHVLRHMLNHAIPKYLEVNPLIGMRGLRQEDTQTRILTIDEEYRLLKMADPIERAAVLCGLDALMRLSSVARLRRDHDHRTYVTVLNGKNGTYDVATSDRLREALDHVPKGTQRYFER